MQKKKIEKNVSINKLIYIYSKIEFWGQKISKVQKHGAVGTWYVTVRGGDGDAKPARGVLGPAALHIQGINLLFFFHNNNWRQKGCEVFIEKTKTEY